MSHPTKSHYRRVEVVRSKYAEVHGDPDPVDNVKYKWPLGEEAGASPEVKVISAQEDMYREENGERVINRNKARITFASTLPMTRYTVQYEDGPTQWEDVEVEVEGEQYIEYFIPETLMYGLYSFTVKIEANGEEVVSDLYYFEILRIVDTTPTGFDPTGQDEWDVWGEVDYPLNPVLEEGEQVEYILNTSTREVDGQIRTAVSDEGDPFYTLSLGGMNTRASLVNTEGDSGYKTDVTLNKNNYPLHIIAVIKVLIGTLSLTNYVVVWRTGNLGNFGGFSYWRLYRDRIDVYSINYGIGGSFEFDYTIPFDYDFPEGYPVVVHLYGNESTDEVVIRVNGRIIGGVSQSAWTETAGSINTGQVGLTIFPEDDAPLNISFSAFGFGRVAEGYLSEEVVGNTTTYLLDKYGIEGEYEPLV